MVRYLNGDTTTRQGKQRAENGHSRSYHVKYIEIGNEEVIGADDIAQYEHYTERFLLLYRAIHQADPSVRLINAAWWRPDSPNMERVFKALDGKAAYWDLHVWADAPDAGKEIDSMLSRMRSMFLKWDPFTDMKCAILEENGDLHDLQRALGHASVLNAVRRHADFVLTSCAANALQPLGQNDNGWDQGQIFFTPSEVWGMPPFYAQQMAAENHEPLLVEAHVEGPLDVTATRSADGHTLIVHVVNASEQTIPAHILISGIREKPSQAEVYTLSGPLNAINTAEQPARISTHKKQISVGKDRVQYHFDPHSYTILRMKIETLRGSNPVAIPSVP
jgi:alpha-L-arabinofuranosidase